MRTRVTCRAGGSPGPRSANRVVAALCFWTGIMLLNGSAANAVVHTTSVPTPSNYLVLDDFSDSVLGSVPRDWKWRDQDNDKPKDYVVRQEGGRRYVAARDSGQSVILIRKLQWNPREYPIMTWCWKALALPRGGDERYTETNDSAAGVYVIFSRSWIGVPRQIKYVWSTTLPVGTIGRRKGFGRPWFVVMESGAQRVGQWTMEQVDLERDYRRIHKRALPEKTLGVGMLTDGNSTGTLAAASYADFRVWRRNAVIPDYCACRNDGASGQAIRILGNDLDH